MFTDFILQHEKYSLLRRRAAPLASPRGEGFGADLQITIWRLAAKEAFMSATDKKKKPAGKTAVKKKTQKAPSGTVKKVLRFAAGVPVSDGRGAV